MISVIVYWGLYWGPPFGGETTINPPYYHMNPGPNKPEDYFLKKEPLRSLGRGAL